MRQQKRESESKRILQTIQRKAINPITDKPMFRTSDEVMEEALMRKTRLTRSGCYKVAMEDFYFKHFPRR